MTIVRIAFLDALPRPLDLDALSSLLEFKQPPQLLEHSSLLSFGDRNSMHANALISADLMPPDLKMFVSSYGKMPFVFRQ